MNRKRFICTIVLCVVLGVMWVYITQRTGDAQESPKYVGNEVCSTCHLQIAKTWALTAHRKTLFNDDPARKGCEACHGPGGEHVLTGDAKKILRVGTLSSRDADDVCLKCHTEETVTLWHTGQHSRAKLTCINCHDPHAPDAQTLLKDIENGKLSLEGLTRSIQQIELASAAAPEGSEDKAAAQKRLHELQAQREKLQEELKGTETIYNRVAEPNLCYSCHKAQQIQTKMPSHHPISEGKMDCSDCHNPHGGPHGLLRQESVNETCFRCHAEKAGPFTFDHPPVSEDCTACHQPHGSVHNNLLAQSEPFVCLKCHAGPHSRPPTRGRQPSLQTGEGFAQYYSECTDCHNQVHGSDEHAALHY